MINMQDSVSEGDCVDFLNFFSFLPSFFLLHCNVESLCPLMNLIARICGGGFACKLNQTSGDVGDL